MLSVCVSVTQSPNIYILRTATSLAGIVAYLQHIVAFLHAIDCVSDIKPAPTVLILN